LVSRWALGSCSVSSTGLGYVYMMHFVSAISNSGTYHEFKELRSDADGVIQVPNSPGFGVDIDPDFLRKATVVTA
jgi:L-alanine-DL-glutamate epimerase-like enolase superfamily enzyme